MRPLSVWETNPQAVEILKACHAAGDSASVIGIKLGTTRNAVIGKLHRMGLHSFFRSPGGNTEAFKGRKHVTARRRLASGLPPGRELTDLEPEAMSLNPVDILNAGAGQCRWPVSGSGLDMLCCGDPVAERPNPCAELPSYCPHHCDIAYRSIHQMQAESRRYRFQYRKQKRT